MMRVDPIKSANGSTVDIPLFDPVVAAHFGNANSMTATLMDEIFLKEIYAPLFKGRKDLTFLDIGANVGLVSLYAYDACARIVAVEPSQVFDVLKALTLALTKIEPIRVALAPKDGPCDFFTNDVNMTASSTINTFGTKSTVSGLTLSSILSIYQLEHVDVCKVDTEGAEELSLNGHELSSASNVVDCWWIETHSTPNTRWEETLTRLAATLDYLGYHSQAVHGMRLLVSK